MMYQNIILLQRICACVSPQLYTELKDLKSCPLCEMKLWNIVLISVSGVLLGLLEGKLANVKPTQTHFPLKQLLKA